MVEKDFQRALEKGLQSQGCYAEAWPDLAYAVTKPFDICAAYRNRFMPIECKITKYQRQKRLNPSDRAIGPANFRGRGHQLPYLLKLRQNDYGCPFVAICVVRMEGYLDVETFAWMLPVEKCAEKKLWTIGDLADQSRKLVWKPTVGWCCPWLKDALAFVDKEEP